MYRIKITYDTGSSFHQEYGVVDYVDEVVFNNIEAADAAIEAIDEHYEYKTLLSGRIYSFQKKEADKMKADIESKLWYQPFDFAFGRMSDVNDYTTWGNQLNLLDDNGDVVIVRAFWCGYFESLVDASLEVIPRKERELAMQIYEMNKENNLTKLKLIENTAG